MDWFRWWHGTLTDPKLRWVARKSGCQLTSVVTAWVALLECASNVAGGDADVTRGDVAGFDCDAHDALLDVDDGTCARILAAFVDKGMVKDGRIANWEKRQPKREDAGDPATGAKSAAQRKRDQRERERASVASATDDDTQRHDGSHGVTHCHDASRDFTTEEIRGEEKRENLNLPTPAGLVVASEADDQPQERQTTKKPDCPHQEIIALYHDLLPASPAIRDWTPTRAAHLRARWNEDAKRQSLDWWRRFFAFVGESPFLTGKVTSNGRKPFMASLDWLCKAENFAKVREGRFHDAEAA
jgi:hypothetical protein